MTLLWHELKQGRRAWLAWAGCTAFLLAVCVLIYPEMEGQMDQVSALFSDLGGFSAAFGMDRLSFGEFSGYFGVECGTILGLGGALYAAFIGIGALAKEEGGKTADFLFAHPLRRSAALAQKLAALAALLLFFDLAQAAATALTVAAIGQTPPAGPLALLFFANFLLQLQVTGLCFGLSAFCRRASPGMGMGIAALFYFLELISNLTEKAQFLKYLTPFSYTEAAGILEDRRLEGRYLAAGLALGLLGVAAAFIWYPKKDLA